MQDAWLGRLFVRFRDRRDGRALAAVFDATARELLGVAAHLVPTADQAEDVVQTTFQRAIEHAERFDGEHSLKGWLYGILWREAAKLTRAERRTLAPGALEPRSVPAPEEEAAGRELPEAVRAALARLPSPYREVLVPVLLEERSARDVAAHLARSPGTVRVQIQRGLERLRRELPSAQRGIPARRALGALGLAPLRERVLEHAGFAPAAVPAASAAFLTWQLAAVAVTPSVLLGATALTAAAGLAVARQQRLRPADGRGETRAGLTPAADPVASRGEVAPHSSPVREADSTRAPTSEEHRDRGREARPPTRARLQPGVQPQVTGIVVDTADRPLGGVTVQAEAENHYGLESTASDEDGRFAFGDLAAGRWYFHVDDPRFARMWWQTHGVGIEEDDGEVLEADLKLVLVPPHTGEGTVVDEGGAPVAGVKVTLALELLAGEAEPLQRHLKNELATTESDERGRFVLERLRPGEMTVVLDHPDFARTLASFQVPGEAPRLVIEGGMRLEGEVVHAEEPLAGVRVRAYPARESELAMGDWQPETDELGRFHIEHVHPIEDTRLQGVPTLTLQVSDAGWFSGVYRVFESERRTLPFVRIEARALGAGESGPKEVDVGRDLAAEARAQGKPFGDGQIHVRLADSSSGPVPVWLAGLSPELQSVQEHGSVAGGEDHGFEHLAPGSYRVSPQNSGSVNYAPETVELGPGELREVVLRPGAFTLRGRILCAGATVESCSVSARSIRGGSGQRARGTSGNGEYEISGLVPGTYELLVQDEGAFVQSFEALVEGDTLLDLELPPGRIEGRLGFDRASEGNDFRVMVFPHGWYQESGNRGVFVDPNAEGRFTVRHVAPGDYAVSTWRAKQHVRSQVVTITAGAPVQEVELVPAAELGRLAGRVTSSVPGSRPRLSIAVLTREPQGLRRTEYCEVDEAGLFDEELEPGRHALLVSNFERGGDAQPRAPFLWVPDVTITAGATTELALTLPPGRTVSIRLDADGSWTPRSIWRLRMSGEDWLPFVLFIGSEAEGRRAGTRPFQLPYGTYAVEADFGDPAPVVQEFTVVPGDGVQEIVVRRP